MKKTNKSPNKSKVILIMPAYEVGKVIEKTFKEIPRNIADEVIVVDDGSQDNTAYMAKSLGATVFKHSHNLGYGGAQKTAYQEALKMKADVVAMLHADNQHDASYLDKIIDPIIKGKYDIMFGSRIKNRKQALSEGMPLTKFIINRSFTILVNFILKTNSTEHLCGFRAYSRKALDTVPFMRLSNDYAFDPQFEVSAVALGLKIGETPIPARYSKEAGSINFFQGFKLLFDSLLTLFKFILYKLNIFKDPIFRKQPPITGWE